MNNGIPNVVKGRSGGVVLGAFNSQDLPLDQGWGTFFVGACPDCPQISKNTVSCLWEFWRKNKILQRLELSKAAATSC
jgi:hypothetical protein